MPDEAVPDERDPDVTEPGAIELMLRPRSVAIVGASQSPTSHPGRALAALLEWDFPGDIYLVNPKYEELGGLPCFPSVTAVGKPVDLAIVMVSATLAEDVLRECAEVGVRAAVVFASGFGETGEEGAAAQARIAELARRSGMRILGPNCQGYFSQAADLVASFSASLRTRLQGTADIAYVGQSGAVGGSIAGLASDRGISLRAWFTTGNQADLSATEIATALTAQPDISVILLHLEALPAGDEWRALLVAARTHDVELVVLRSGTTAVGARATASHTGSIVGDDLGFRLLAQEHGVHLVEDTDELVETGDALLQRRRMAGDGVAVITSSGGGGALVADWLTRCGLAVPELGPDAQDCLRGLVPTFGEVRNPVDVTAQLFTADDDAFERVADLTLGDEAVSGVVVLLTNVIGAAGVRTATQVAAAARRTAKPVVVVWVASEALTVEGRAVLREERVPLFDSIGPAVRLLERLRDRDEPCGTTSAPVAEICRDPAVADALAALVPRTGEVTITEYAAGALLDAAGIARPAGDLATDAARAAEIAASLGERVVLKVSSSEILHKSNVGGVAVGVPAAAAGEAYDELLKRVRRFAPDAVVDGVLVQELASGGVELLVGITRAGDGYPPLVTVGIGGVATEIYADVASGVCPVTLERARELVLGLRGAPLLTGFRNSSPLDVDAAARAVSRLSEIAVSGADVLAELEINPLIVHERGATAADVLLHLRATSPTQDSRSSTPSRR